MTKELWINLPVKDVNRSKEFFSKLGFKINERGSNEHSVCFLFGIHNIPVLFFEENMFKGFSQNELADTARCSEVLISFDAESREGVDEMAQKAADAGANVFAKPTEIQGWMYGCAFADPDGHRWNVLYMDMSKQQ